MFIDSQASEETMQDEYYLIGNKRMSAQQQNAGRYLITHSEHVLIW